MQEGIRLDNDQQKDEILKGFCTFGTGVPITPEELIKRKLILTGIDKRDLIDLLDFLVSKGYINSVKDKQLYPDGERAYSLTVAGRLFVQEDGGFENIKKQKIKTELLEKDRIDLQMKQNALMEAQTAIQESQTKIQAQMKTLTKILAVAAIIAVAWDMWKFYYSCR